ncbi:MAG: glycerophosphodiester phosphodiesterase [Candidatus Saccharibacteria bacterium]|nr:glycerophosphodiester phosphodiesterase [Candidatus Saccharibacteria bacterium]
MWIYGHRGAMGLAPENTIIAIKKGLEINVDMIEIDVFVLPCGEIIVIHDDTLERTTSGRGKVVDTSFKQLRTLDAGEGQKIPTLDEVVKVIDGRVLLNIEIKGKGSAKAVAKAIRRYTARGKLTANHFLVSSFDHNEVRMFHHLMPDVPISALFHSGDTTNFVERTKQLDTSMIGTNMLEITHTLMHEAKLHGIEVMAYPSNITKEEEIALTVKLFDLGVLGVFSNYPDAARAAITPVTARPGIRAWLTTLVTGGNPAQSLQRV